MTLDGEAVTDAPLSYTWSSGEAPVDAGSYTLTVSAGGDYIGNKVIGFTIGRAGVTITADSLTASVGGEKPVLTYTVDGFVGTDELAVRPVLACNADMDTAGSYIITASGAAVPGTGNYDEEITYVPGTLTVIEEEVEVPPDPPAGEDETKFQIVMEAGISAVPEGLKNIAALNTPE